MNITTVLNVEDSDAFAGFATETLTAPNSTVHTDTGNNSAPQHLTHIVSRQQLLLQGPVNVHAVGLTFSNIDMSKNVTLNGKSGREESHTCSPSHSLSGVVVRSEWLYVTATNSDGHCSVQG